MILPPLLILPEEADYRKHYEYYYVNGPAVVTFDGITVKFYSNTFDHAFYRDSSRTSHDKGKFDRGRAERMDWIRVALEDRALENFRRVMPRGKVRRITLAYHGNYAIVTQIDSQDTTRARFITAYLVDSPSALIKMRSNSKW